MNLLLANHLIGFSLLSFILPAIALIVYKSRPQSTLNKTFAAYQLSIGWWAFFTIFMIVSKTREMGLFWDKVCLTGVVFIPSTLFHFIVAYSQDTKRFIVRVIIAVNYFISLIFLAVLWFSTHFVVDVQPKFGLKYFTVPGHAYIFFVAFFVLNVVIALTFLWRYSRRSSNALHRKQAVTLFWFSVVGYAGGCCNYLLVYDISLPGVAETSNYGILILSLSIAYIIFRYRFLDIEVIIKKTIVFAGLFTGALGLVVGFSALIEHFLGSSFNVPQWVSMGVGVALAIFLYEPTKTLLVEVTDRFLFQKKNDIRVILNNLSESIVTIIDIHKIGQAILSTLQQSLRLESGALIIHDEKENNYFIHDSFGVKTQDLRLEQTSMFVRYFENFKGIVNLDLEDTRNPWPDEIKSVIRQLNGVVCMPLYIQGRLLGFLTLGKKLSDQEYGKEELEYFPSVAGQVAVALNNAQLVDELVVEKSEKMAAQKKAELVNYTRTFKHEGGNALVGIESTVLNMKNQMSDRLSRFEKKLEGRLEPREVKMYAEFSQLLEKYAGNIEGAAVKMRMIMDTVVGALSNDQKAMQVVFFRVPWETAKRNVDIDYAYRFMVDAPENCRIFGNAILIERIFENFLTNSRDALAGEKEKNIFLNISEREHEGRQVTWFEYWDSGPGVPEKLYQKVFEQGFSTKPVPESGISAESGHGFGLYTCRKTIEEIHHGKIWLETHPETGKSRFVFWLPSVPSKS